MNKIGAFAVPVIVFVIIINGLVRKEKIFNCFCDGAKDGLKTVLSITPSLVGLVTAIEVFKASGALDILVYSIKPVTDLLNVPSDIVPLSLLRPISGSGSISLLNSILKSAGPDSFVGRVASVMCGATDTTFYAVTVYFGSVEIKNTRHTLWCGITADIASLIMSIITVSLFLN